MTRRLIATDTGWTFHTATVILFRTSGKYYTEEEWEIPADAILPSDMVRSRDFHRIGNGAVLVESQEPWGYPHLFPSNSPTPHAIGLEWDHVELCWRVVS